MGSSSSRSVELQICNNTQDTTLMKPRTFFKCGRCSKRPRPELSPGSSDTCSFSGDPEGGAVSGTLVYEAEFFTLAIHFYNPVDYNRSSPRLGLELSPDMAHLDNLEATHRRMARGDYSSSDRDIEFARVIVGRGLETARVSHGPIKVMAAVSSGASARIKVMLEEE